MNELCEEIELSETRKKVQAAHVAIQELCKGVRFRMSIPANHSRDHDLILSDALLALDADLESSLAANRDLQTMLDVRTIEIKNAEEENDQLSAANREQKAEIERLKIDAGNIEAILRAYDYKGDSRDKLLWLESDMLTAQRKQKMFESQLASLRASVGEKPEDAWKRGWVSGWNSCFNKHPSYHPKPYVAPTLPGEEK